MYVYVFLCVFYFFNNLESEKCTIVPLQPAKQTLLLCSSLLFYPLPLPFVHWGQTPADLCETIR